MRRTGQQIVGSEELVRNQTPTCDTAPEQEIVIANMLLTYIVIYVRLISNRAWPGLLPPLTLLLTGCGGFVASPSLSPAMFFLPGLGQNTSTNSQLASPEPGFPPAQPL
jgi:hypothetical protein